VARQTYVITVQSADLDQPSLHAILESMREMGLELVDVRRGSRSAD
jgi:hypothetical protein